MVLDIFSEFLLYLRSIHVKHLPTLSLIGISHSDCSSHISWQEISPYTHVVPYTEDVKSYLDLSYILLLPSMHEGFGYAYLEAASRGNLLVGYDIPGPDSILVDNQTGRSLPLDSLALILLIVL